MTISHSQYYTSDEIARLVVKCISKDGAKTILDLGAGNGSLSRAAQNKWNKAHFIVVDIDKENYNILIGEGFEAKNIDCLIPNLDKEIEVAYESIDVGVCNPPYHSIDNRDYIGELLSKVGLQINRKERVISSDLVFLAYNLLFLKPKGILGIIVPFSIMAGKNYSQIRRSLYDNYYLERVIELPEKSFTYTEAKTGILIIRKENHNGRRTKLNTVFNDFKLSPPIMISQRQAVQRIDYSYHYWKKEQGNDYINNNEEIRVVRGRCTYADLLKKGMPFFHLTCYFQTDIDWSYPYKTTENSIVKKGSFLLARVGKRCVGRVRYIEEGSIQISDCIYGITVPYKYIDDFKQFFKTDEYSRFIKTVTRGICSLYLCKGDIKDMLLKKLYEFKKKEKLRRFD